MNSTSERMELEEKKRFSLYAHLHPQEIIDGAQEAISRRYFHFLDTIVAGICNIEITAAVCCDRPRNIKLSVGTAAAAPLGKEITVAVKFLDTVVIRICNIEIPGVNFIVTGIQGGLKTTFSKP